MENETTLKDVQKGRIKNSLGFKKVRGFCDIIRKRNEHIQDDVLFPPLYEHRGTIDWLWIDTVLH